MLVIVLLFLLPMIKQGLAEENSSGCHLGFMAYDGRSSLPFSQLSKGEQKRRSTTRSLIFLFESPGSDGGCQRGHDGLGHDGSIAAWRGGLGVMTVIPKKEK